MPFTITKPIVHEIKIKRSRFICYLFPTNDLENAKEKIRAISQQNHNASHNCWCYRLGKQGEIEHASDAGEPSGTAGKPMLGQLKKGDVSDVVAIVTRYFGGVKLGVSGLINAYGTVVKEALEKVPQKELFDSKKYTIQTTYDFADIFKYEVQTLSANLANCSYEQYVQLELEIRLEDAEQLENYLNEMEKSGKIKRINEKKAN